MAVAPLPFTAIVEFARIYNVENFEEFNDIIRSMDRAYLDFKDKKQDATKPTDQRNNSKN